MPLLRVRNAPVLVAVSRHALTDLRLQHRQTVSLPLAVLAQVITAWNKQQDEAVFDAAVEYVFGSHALN
jgi:hypothetical protein